MRSADLYFDGDNKEVEIEEGLNFQTSNFTLQTSFWDRLNKIPAQVWAIFLVVFGFWFGGRAVSDARGGKNG